MATQATTSQELHDLLQNTYFHSIDTGDADTAVTALHEDVAWFHTQVWEHDGHSGQHTDTIDGRGAVHEFLADRIGEMQREGIEHKVREVVVDGTTGAFRAEVVDPDGDTQPFLGWVELTDDVVSKYVVTPGGMPDQT